MFPVFHLPLQSHTAHRQKEGAPWEGSTSKAERDAVSKLNGAAAVPAFSPGPQETLLSHWSFFTYSVARMMEMTLCKGGMENGSFTLSQSLGYALLLRIFLFLSRNKN